MTEIVEIKAKNGCTATLYCGDCLEVLPTLGKVDAVITSPPYNCGMEYGICKDDLTSKEYWDAVERWFSLCAANLSSHGYSCWNVPNWIGSREEQVYALNEYHAIFGRHLRFVDPIVWDKGPPRGAAWGNPLTTPRIRAGHENVLVYEPHNPTKRPTRMIDVSEWSALTVSVWRIQPTLPEREAHPATFPYEVPARLIKLYAYQSATILDPFMGSGTTGVAALRHGCNFIGIEIEPKYFAIAKRRIEAEAAQGKLFG